MGGSIPPRCDPIPRSAPYHTQRNVILKTTLIDTYLPRYTFREYHETMVNCPIATAYDVARDFDLSKSKLIVLLFRLRGLPTKRMHLQDFIVDMGFTHLEETPPFENLSGFWMRPRIEKIHRYEDFVDASISSWIKVVWNFRFREMDQNMTTVSTETRILCEVPITKVTFGLYWTMIKPFSGLIRKEMLSIIKADSENTHERRS